MTAVYKIINRICEAEELRQEAEAEARRREAEDKAAEAAITAKAANGEASFRMKRIVHLLTKNERTTLNRAWKIAGYGRHRCGWPQFLRSPVVVSLFREALENGRTLPYGREKEILEAIAKLDAEELA